MSDIIKILFLAANPKNTDRLRLDEEINSIDKALRQTDFRDKFSIMGAWAVQATDIQGLLLRYKPEIVHFSGHGSDVSEIILEDKEGRAKTASERSLSNLFSILKDNVRCVLLNACYSDRQAQAIANHIECVVGMSRAIGDVAATLFASAFYQGLGYGRDIKTAFELGCNAIDLVGLGEQDTPKLIAPRVDPSSVILVTDVKSGNSSNFEAQSFDADTKTGVSKIYSDSPKYDSTFENMKSKIVELHQTSSLVEIALLQKKSELAFREMSMWSSRAKILFEEIVGLSRALYTMSYLVDAHRNIALIDVYEGNFTEADHHFNLAEETSRKYCDWLDTSRVLFTKAIGLRFQGQYQTSKKALNEALTILQQPSLSNSAEIGFLDLLCEMDLAFLELIDAPFLGSKDMDTVIAKLEKTTHKQALMSARFKRAIFYLYNNNILAARGSADLAKKCCDISFQPNWIGNFILFEGFCSLLDNAENIESHFYEAYRNFSRARFLEPLWITASTLYFLFDSTGRMHEAKEAKDRYTSDKLANFHKAAPQFNELIPISNDSELHKTLAKLFVQI